MSFTLQQLPIAWTPNTRFKATQWIITPAGALGQALTTHTTGDTFDASLYDISQAQGAPGPQGAVGPAGPPTQIAVYTRATMPAATGSGDTIFVTDDGPGTLFKDTATGVWTPLNPGEIAYAANVSGTATVTANGQVSDIQGCTITVPPTTRPVWLRVGATFQQTVAGTGDVSLYLYDITGAAALVTNFLEPLPNMISGGDYVDLERSYRLGPVSTARTFKISAVTIVTSSTPSAKTINTVANPTFLLAESK